MTPAKALKADARAALQAGDQRRALRLLLEADAVGGPDVWVLESLARIHRRLSLPERGLGYVKRALELSSSDALRALERTLESDSEIRHRDRARFELAAGRPGRAFDAAMEAASGPDPSTWTLRVLADAALASNHRATACELVERARERRPDDAKLGEIGRRLRG